jgi:hypothetical protein
MRDLVSACSVTRVASGAGGGGAGGVLLLDPNTVGRCGMNR